MYKVSEKFWKNIPPVRQLNMLPNLRFSFALVLCLTGTSIVYGYYDDDDDYLNDPNYKYCMRAFNIDATQNPTGEIKSPLYGEENYPNGLSCYYNIKIPREWRVKVTFKDFQLDAADSCSRDYLDFYGEEGNNVLAIFCGSDIPRPILSEKGDNVIRLHFQTDMVGSGRGFHLYYEAGPDIDDCPPDHILCRNRNCVPNSKKCDGVDDCEDGTDEQKCGFPVITPADCGNPAIQPNTLYDSPDRIVGGQEAIPHSWPWQVSLNKFWIEPSSHFCGGTLINSQWVVTAAHCFRADGDPDYYSVHLGMHDKYKKDSGEQKRYTEKIIGYPDLEYDNLRTHNGIHNDIALIKLNAPVNFTKTVQPACLPAMGWDLPEGTECYATGWGETRGSGFNHALKQTMQIVQSTTDCLHDPKHQICVTHPKYYNSPCHGDSGGPLSCNLGGKWFVVGDLSYASRGNMLSGGLCGMPENRIIYSKVSDKIDWINLMINKFS